MPKIGIGGTGNIDHIQMDEQGSTPSTPAAGKSAIFLKADGLYVIDDAGAVTGPLGAGGGTPAMVQLAESLLASPAANMDLTSISGSYRHLKLIIQTRTTAAVTAESLNLRLNNDSGANYYMQFLYGSATSAVAGESLGATSYDMGGITGTSGLANLPSHFEILLANYAQTTFLKTIRVTAGDHRNSTSGNLFVGERTGFWNSTAAISRITLTPATGNLATGTLVSLYGIN